MRLLCLCKPAKREGVPPTQEEMAAMGKLIEEFKKSEPSLKSSRLLPNVRGDLLAKLGRHSEARAEFKRAASLTRNARERQLLLERAAGSENK